MNVKSVIKTSISLFAAIMLLAACTGVPMKTKNLQEGDYEVIGKGTATATGIMLFNFIPIGQNSRQVRAQNAAIERMGGDAMINTQVQESWFWAWILNGYKSTVTGDVVKLKNK